MRSAFDLDLVGGSLVLDLFATSCTICEVALLTLSVPCLSRKLDVIWPPFRYNMMSFSATRYSQIIIRISVGRLKRSLLFRVVLHISRGLYSSIFRSSASPGSTVVYRILGVGL